MNSQLVGVLIGGLIAALSLLAGIVVTELFQRRRDRRAQLISKYETLALTARTYQTKAVEWAQGRGKTINAAAFANRNTPEEVSHFTLAYREVVTARDRFLDAKTILSLEVDQEDVLNQCDKLDEVYLYNELDFSQGDFFEHQATVATFLDKFIVERNRLEDILRVHKRRLETNFPKISVPLPAHKK